MHVCLYVCYFFPNLLPLQEAFGSFYLGFPADEDGEARPDQFGVPAAMTLRTSFLVPL